MTGPRDSAQTSIEEPYAEQPPVRGARLRGVSKRWKAKAPAWQSSISVPWTESGWLDSVTAWVGTHIELAGQVERIDKHVKPWSVVARVTTTDGVLWLKECGPAVGHEPALTHALAQHAAEFVPDVVAVDDTRILMHDAGAQLSGFDELDSPRWLEMVARYAELQIKLAGTAAGLPAPDYRPRTLEASFGDQVTPLVEALGDKIPTSLVHLDLSQSDVRRRNGNLIFLDWGSSGMAHAFCGLVETLRALVRHHGATPGSREVLRVRDAYLEPWTTRASLKELQGIFSAANALGVLCRAAVWERRRALHALQSPSVRKVCDRKIQKWLTSFEIILDAPDRLGEYS